MPASNFDQSALRHIRLVWVAVLSTIGLMTGQTVLGEPSLLVVAAQADNADLLLIDLGRGNERNLTRGPAINAYPAWSRDGKRIAYAATSGAISHVYAIDPDGKNRRQLTAEDSSDRVPAFSPDGKQIAFCRRPARGGVTSLYVMDAANGGNLKLLQEDGYDPAWSPDGKQIAFVSIRNGSGFHLFVMQADGSQVKELTTTDKKQGYVYPDWSPDGKKIAFTEVVDNQDWEIHVIDADGSNLKQLTRLAGMNTYAAWSPDGQQIAFRHHDRDRSPGRCT
jgi:TolB protein